MLSSNPKRNGTFDYDDLFPHYGGEYLKDVVDRMYNTLKDIMDKEDHQNVLAVSHGGACYSFLSSVADPSVVNNHGGFTNCCILHFEYEDGQFNYIDIMNSFSFEEYYYSESHFKQENIVKVANVILKKMGNSYYKDINYNL